MYSGLDLVTNPKNETALIYLFAKYLYPHTTSNKEPVNVLMCTIFSGSITIFFLLFLVGTDILLVKIESRIYLRQSFSFTLERSTSEHLFCHSSSRSL